MAVQSFDGETQPDRERDELADLLASPGWRRFCEYVAGVWNDAETLARIAAFVGHPKVDEQRETAGQICAAKRAVETVMSWPNTRVHALTTPVTARTLGRPHRRARV
jgi:hypothetical protein